MKAEELFASVCTGMSLEQVARAHGMTSSGVWNSLQRAGLPTSHRAAVRAGVADPKTAWRPPQRIGWKGYATILRAVQIKPRTYGEIASAAGGGVNNIRRVINRMQSLGLVHIAGWEQRKPRTRPQALFSFGPGEEAPYPKDCKRPAVVRNPKAYGMHRPELIAFAVIIRALAEPVTRAHLVDLAGSTSCNISKLIQHCKAIGLVRIAGWDTSRPGKPAEELSIGCARDAARPAPMPKHEVQRRSRAAAKQRASDQWFMRALVQPSCQSVAA